MYWRPDTDRTGVLDHAASDQFGKVARGDEVWFVTIDDELLLFGHMIVGEVMSQSAVEALLGTTDLWEAKYHIVPEGSPKPYREVRIANIALDLRFDGGVDRLPRDYSGRNLQSMRALTSESAQMLKRVWAGGPVRLPDAQAR